MKKLIVIIILQSIVVIYLLLSNKCKSEEYTHINQLVDQVSKFNVYNLINCYKGAELYDNQWKIETSLIKQETERLLKNTNKEMVDKYCDIIKYYFNDKEMDLVKKTLKDIQYSKNIQYKTMVIKTIEGIIYSTMYVIRLNAYFPFDKIRVKVLNDGQQIKYGQQYSSEITAYLTNSKSEIIAIMDNGDTIRNDSSHKYPFFKEKINKKGKVLHSGNLVFFHMGSEFKVPFEFNYTIE